MYCILHNIDEGTLGASLTLQMFIEIKMGSANAYGWVILENISLIREIFLSYTAYKL